MGLKEFKSFNGIANNETAQNIITIPITSNSAVTIDTVALSIFYSIEYSITIVQGTKIRTSKIAVQTDGTNVDYTEYGVVTTGGSISGVGIVASASGSNMILQITVTDAATTIARVRAIKNIMGIIQPYAPGAPVIGTATAGAEQATVTFTAPADNGLSAITSYLATSTPGNITGSAASSPITVTGLTSGTAYTFIIQAINAYGRSLASSASNSVTPTAVPVKAGFVAGGEISGGSTNNIQKIIFSNDATSTISTTLSVAKYRLAGFANSGTAGYVSGGYNASSVKQSNIEKFLFSGESISTISSTLSATSVEGAGMANSGTAGYIALGYVNSSVNTVDKLLFSNDSTSTLGTGLSSARYAATGFANSGTAGYFSNGSPGVTTVDKFAFSNDSRSTLSSGTFRSKYSAAGASNNGVAGYIGGGYDTGAFAARNYVEKIQYSNDSRFFLNNYLSVNTYALAGFANSGTAGYFAAGYNGSFLSNVDRYNFSDDTKTAVNALPVAKGYVAGFANSGIL